ncbi:MAG: hypothetical protein BWY37_02092 [Firmicutes bacterium ADurb.Bin262]|nr:MAG: hypothetical protein BWY37_02092 [Firmicutes bacterium ADurb.Bin262]
MVVVDERQAVVQNHMFRQHFAVKQLAGFRAADAVDNALRGGGLDALHVVFVDAAAQAFAPKALRIRRSVDMRRHDIDADPFAQLLADVRPDFIDVLVAQADAVDGGQRRAVAAGGVLQKHAADKDVVQHAGGAHAPAVTGEVVRLFLPVRRRNHLFVKTCQPLTFHKRCPCSLFFGHGFPRRRRLAHSSGRPIR